MNIKKVNKMIAGMLSLTLVTTSMVSVPGSLVDIQAANTSDEVAINRTGDPYDPYNPYEPGESDPYNPYVPEKETDSELEAAQKAFQELSEKMNLMNKELYGEESWNTLQSAFEDAKKEFDKGFAADVPTLNQLSSQLNEVLTGLLNKEMQLAWEAYGEQRARYETLTESYYTRASWTNVKLTYVKAEAEYKKGDKANAQNLTALSEELRLAINSLEKNLYKVTYLTIEGTYLGGDEVYAGDTLIAPEVGARSGYTFLGWFVNDQKFDFSAPVTESLELVQKWEEDQTLKTAKEAFKTLAEKVANMNQALYTEDSWSKFEETYQTAKTEYEKGNDANASLLGDLTAAVEILIQTLVKKSYTVSFDSAGGTGIVNQVVAIDSTVTKPEDPLKSGYIFAGWYVDGNPYNFDASVRNTLTLTAKWEENTNLKAAKNAFQTISDKINGMDKNLYTADSWNKMYVEYENTKAEFAKEAAVDVNILQQLTTSLEDAINKLVRIDVAAPVQTPGGTVTPVQQDVKVTDIEITGFTTKVAAGKKIQLTAEVAPENVTNGAVKWTSSDTDYATVNAKGVVKTKEDGAGEWVTITATALDGSGVVAEYDIKIMEEAVQKITLKANVKEISVGQKATITATVAPAVSKTKINNKLEWMSSNTNYATVSKKGIVKAKKKGVGKSVKITATATDGSKKKATITIKIKK